MGTLSETQRAVTQAIFDRDGQVPASLSRIGDSSAEPFKRFSVYRNNVVMSLSEVLEAYFPVVLRLVGEQFFRALVREFILAYPPTSPILSRYGSGFAEFLTQFEPVSDLPYLPDVARLEWLQQRAYHAADAKPLNPIALTEIPEDDAPLLRFEFHPATYVFSSRFPVFSIWRTNTFDTEVRPIGNDASPESVIVVRPQLDVLTLGLPDGAFELIEDLIGGATLLSATERARDRNVEFALAPILAILVDLGALVAVTVSRPDQSAVANTCSETPRENIH